MARRTSPRRRPRTRSRRCTARSCACSSACASTRSPPVAATPARPGSGSRWTPARCSAWPSAPAAGSMRATMAMHWPACTPRSAGWRPWSSPSRPGCSKNGSYRSFWSPSRWCWSAGCCRPPGSRCCRERHARRRRDRCHHDAVDGSRTMSLREYFAWPSLWPILLAAPLLWLLLAVTDRARARRLATVVGPRSAALAPGCQPQQRRLRRALTALGLLLALLAVLQPLLGAGARKFEQRGNDILVCLDVSRSMLARDLPPSRLLAARRELRALAERARGDRLGLLVFAGEARLSVPLTQDHDAFMAMVELADPLSVRRGGTDLGAALERALAALAGQDSDHQVVLLLSDGEDHEQRGRQIAERFRQQNIP